ncbi:trophoblast glycoprotein-like [Sinocyclocheilus anshuiensis]|uniref:Trophoblast glycoprotein-like n=1 Tax=Sinocyclocheilus anshuiensis TaxID=1608454 RepID=A0A671S422_9TELE|nr:PREDICTED: trophoblast glycoprotein-like [Sinocyclocheilus anshuiensis]
MCLFVLSAEAHKCHDTFMRYDGLVSCEEIILPLEVPRSIQNLTLHRYNISVLTERAFSANGTEMDLRALSLQDNNIQVIESCAFCGLPRLLSLDLSHNRLMVVPPGTFYGLEQLRNLNLSNTLMTSGGSQLPLALSTDNLCDLQRLDLSGNRLEVIPLSGFGNLNLTTLILTNNSIATLDSHNLAKLNEFKEIRIYLSQNPFECKCDKLKEFYDWLKNSSQCADSSSLKCAQPEKKKNTHVMDLEKRDMECQNLDARSYVLLGIVLALIGVVFLMVLYLNRRGIKRWLNNIREACRDQMEVYHYRYEQDSDPRLANVAV